MTASLRRTVTVVVAALGVALVLSWSATVGPEGVVGDRQSSSVRTPVDHTSGHASSRTSTTQAPDASVPPHRSLAGWGQDAVFLALLLVGLLVVALALRGLLRLRPRVPEELALTLEPLPDLEAGRSAVERDQEKQREALAGSDVRNGIVACWVIFENAAAAAEVSRRPAETATQFVVRFLHSLDVDPRPVGQLAQLFHEARFSSHPMATDARRRASQALTAIHQDLARSGAPA